MTVGADDHHRARRRGPCMDSKILSHSGADSVPPLDWTWLLFHYIFFFRFLSSIIPPRPHGHYFLRLPEVRISTAKGALPRVTLNGPESVSCVRLLMASTRMSLISCITSGLQSSTTTVGEINHVHDSPSWQQSYQLRPFM